MKNYTYTYTDSEAGAQKEVFASLSQLISHIESFKYTQDSDGVIFQDGVAILEYTSIKSGLIWGASNE